MADSKQGHWEVFVLLLDQVVEQSSVEKAFADFKTSDLRQLSQDLADFFGKEIEESPVRPSTLRDYRSIYLGELPFRTKTEKLDDLCEYISEGHWSNFLKTNKRKTKEPNRSFYKSIQPYQLLFELREELGSMAVSNAKRIRQFPTSPEVIFNYGFTLLYFEKYEESTELFLRGSEIAPDKENFYLFTALSSLGGKRPFQQKKTMIDQISLQINKALDTNPNHQESYLLANLIHNDFHKRIGYNYSKKEFVLKEEPAQSLVWLFARCTSLTDQQIKNLIT